MLFKLQNEYYLLQTLKLSVKPIPCTMTRLTYINVLIRCAVGCAMYPVELKCEVVAK